MATKLLLRGETIDLDKKALIMPQWQQILDQQEDKGQNKYTKSVWANRCITIRSNALSSIEWEIGQYVSEDEFKPVAEEHPLYVLIEEVNPEANWTDLIRATEADLLLVGTAYWWKMGSDTLPQNLMRLNANSMSVKAGSQGIEYFEQDLKAGAKKKYSREEIVFFHYYDPYNDFGGVPPATVAQDAINAEAACNAFLADFFENYAMPAVLLRAPKDVTVQPAEGNRIVRAWRKRFGKSGNQNKVGLIDKGMEAEIIQHPLSELALETVRGESRRDICAAFAVPPAIAGAWEAANYASADEQRQSLYTETTIPEAEYLAGVINAELIKPAAPELEFRWKFAEIPALQPDKDAASERVRGEYRDGLINLETAVSELGYAPEAAGEGKPSYGGFGGGDPNEPPENEPQKRIKSGNGHNPFLQDLAKWQRKAIGHLRKEGLAECEFVSEAIPPSLNAAIEGSLAVAGNEEDVKTIFRDAASWAHYPYAG